MTSDPSATTAAAIHVLLCMGGAAFTVATLIVWSALAIGAKHDDE